jgi:hypothetical protein
LHLLLALWASLFEGMEMKSIEFNNRVITEPGIYENVPIETYHQNPFVCDAPSISASGLKQVIKRPSLYWAYSPYNRHRFEREEKKHFTFGQAVHHLILGEKGFKERFALRPETYPNDPSKKWNANANDCKEWLTENEGRYIITNKDLDAIRHIKSKLEERDEIQQGILNGRIEQTMVAKFGNIWLRSRPDAVPHHDGDFADIKTTNSVSYHDMGKSIYNFGYHVQGALVRKVFREFHNETDFNFFLIFIEKTPPYDVEITLLDKTSLERGEEQINAALPYLEECIKRWEFPGESGFSPTIHSIGIPAWASTQIEQDINFHKAEVA